MVNYRQDIVWSKISSHIEWGKRLMQEIERLAQLRKFEIRKYDRT